MTRSQIEYILALDKHKSFGKAADACFVTQSTLSTMVAKFEKQIGFTVFNRKTKPISLTPNGTQIIKSLKNVQREFKLLDENVNDTIGKEFGNISIACIPTVAPFLYPLILNDISEKYKHVDFTVHEFTTEHIIEELLSGNIDIGIVSTPLEHKDLIEYPLYQEEFFLYDCGKKVAKTIRKVSQIDFDRLWLLEEGHCLRNQIGKICELRTIKKINGNLIYNCGTLFTVLEMVKINKGITLVPQLALHKNKHIIKENIYRLAEPVPTREIGIVVHKNFVKKRILTYLKEAVKEVTAPYLANQSKSQVVVKPF